jgi:hypothetical protein
LELAKFALAQFRELATCEVKPSTQKTMNNIQLKKGLAKLKLEIALFVEGDFHVAYAPALDLVGQGKSNREAIESLLNVIRITLDWAKENDTIHKLLLQHGWTLKEKPSPVYQPPVFNSAQVKKNFSISRFETKKVSIAA